MSRALIYRNPVWILVFWAKSNHDTGKPARSWIQFPIKNSSKIWKPYLRDFIYNQDFWIVKQMFSFPWPWILTNWPSLKSIDSLFPSFNQFYSFNEIQLVYLNKSQKKLQLSIAYFKSILFSFDLELLTRKVKRTLSFPPTLTVQVSF